MRLVNESFSDLESMSYQAREVIRRRSGLAWRAVGNSLEGLVNNSGSGMIHVRRLLEDIRLLEEVQLEMDSREYGLTFELPPETLDRTQLIATMLYTGIDLTVQGTVQGMVGAVLSGLREDVPEDILDLSNEAALDLLRNRLTAAAAPRQRTPDRPRRRHRRMTPPNRRHRR